MGDVETRDVENFNGILRERLGRLVRKTKCFAKVQRRLVCSIEFFQFYWNLFKAFEGGKSPGLIEGLTYVFTGICQSRIFVFF